MGQDSQASTCGPVWAPGPTPSNPNQWKSDLHVKSQTPAGIKPMSPDRLCLNLTAKPNVYINIP